VPSSSSAPSEENNHNKAPNPCKISALVSYINIGPKESKHEKEHFIINLSIVGSGFQRGNHNPYAN
jgi:hypothetical protein